jgi:uroporphyrinogen-III decarboxylase
LNGRERLTATYRGEVPEEMPWAPLIYYDTLSLYPEEIREAGPIEFTRMIGGDVLWRVRSCRIESPRLEVIKREDRDRVYIRHSTAKGDLNEVHRRGGKYCVTRKEVYPVRSPEDYPILEHMYETRQMEPDYESVEKVEEVVGDSGIVMAFEVTTPVQELIQQWMGLNGFYSNMLRHKSDLENLIAAMHESNMRIYEIMAESPLEFNCTVENTDITLVSPRIYAKYSRGHVKDFVDAMHRGDKVALVHMCGKINRLLPLIRETGLDGIDCLTPGPVGDVDFRRVYCLFGDKFVIHGVLNPSLWMRESTDVDDIENEVKNLLEGVEGRPFVLCTAADGIPGIPIQRFRDIGRIMERYRENHSW